MRNILIIIGSILLITGCSEDSLYNFLLGPQPNFTDKKMLEPGLNILGILRPDSVNSKPMSFIHVEKIVAAINEADTLSSEVNDASVMIYKLADGAISDSFLFSYIPNDSTYSMYRSQHIKPQAGDRYRIVCNAPDLPGLSGETIVPDVPVLENDTILYDRHKIRFTIMQDTSAAMYDVYLFTGNGTFTKRIMRTEAGHTKVEMEINNAISSATLTIYVYDKKLAEYFSASNVFIKPNTYRPPFSNVNNGYGCFGSMNMLTKKI